MNRVILFLLTLLLFTFCSGGQEQVFDERESSISCNEDNCSGFYKGPEFLDGEDVAHQFSNSMSAAVGDHLKEFYRHGEYKKVNMKGIRMSTAGMGSGYVIYRLEIPFESVGSECEAFTSFDHCGGWNHKPALVERKSKLEKALLPNEKLDISPLKKTKEGLQEYWIQWKNKEVQADCGNINMHGN